MDELNRLIRNALNDLVAVKLDRHLHYGPPPEHEALRERFTGFRATPIFDALLDDATPAVRLGLEVTHWDRPRREIVAPEGIPDLPKSIFGVPVHTSPMVPAEVAYLLRTDVTPPPVTPAIP